MLTVRMNCVQAGSSDAAFSRRKYLISTSSGRDTLHPPAFDDLPWRLGGLPCTTAYWLLFAFPMPAAIRSMANASASQSKKGTLIKTKLE